MQDQGFGFSSFERKEYLLNIIKQAFAHPVGVYRMWKAFTGTGENPGLGKISLGIDISKSKELVVGLFYKSKI